MPLNDEPGKTTVKIRKPSTNNDNNGIVRNGFVTLFYSYEIEVYNQLQDVYCPVGQGCEWTHTETIYDSYTFYVENIPGASTTFGADYNPWGNYDPCGGVPCTPVIDAWQYSGVGSTDPTPPALFNWTYSGDDGSAFTDPDPSLEPDLQFDPADGYETLYPNFTNVVKNLKTFVKNSPEVMSALQKWSGFTKQQILDKLTFGKGPTVKVVEGLDSYSSYNRATNESVLKMSASWVRGLEAAVLPATKRGTAFIIAVSILHEFVHYGTGRNNISEGQYDFGWGFERSAFHVIVNDLNANEVSLRFKKLP